MERPATYEAMLFSIGHGNRTAAAFVEILLSFGVRNIADIRSYPGSRRNPHFNLEPFREFLGRAGTSYTWFPDLGGLRRKGLGTHSPHKSLTSAGFRNYADWMESPRFALAVQELVRLAGTGHTCLMCAETIPQRCHRLLLADYLLVQGIQLIHILGRGKSTPHLLSPHAKVRQGRLIYDGQRARQLNLNLP